MLYNTTTTTTGARPVTLKTPSKRRKTSWLPAFASTTSRGPTYNRRHGAANTRKTSTTRRDPTVCLTQTFQNLRDERATPLGDPARRDNNVIDNEIRQVNQELNAQQTLQDATTAEVRRAGELLGYFIMHATKPNSEPNNLLRRLQRTNIGWGMYRQFPHQYAARARVQQYTLLQSIMHPQPRRTETSQQQQFQKWIQDVSAYEMIHPVIDDTLKGQYSNKQLARTSTTASLIAGSTTSHLARSTTDTCASLVRPSATSTRTSTSSRTKRVKVRKEKEKEKRAKAKDTTTTRWGKTTPPKNKGDENNT